jgi:hypothetical protein
MHGLTRFCSCYTNPCLTKQRVINNMNPELKDKWVKALRSGEYKQGRGTMKESRLFRKSRFCCLGVLCDVAGAQYNKRNGYKHDVFGEKQLVATVHILTPDGRHAFGLEGAKVDTLVFMNDKLKLDFNEIANYIEKAVKS